MQARGYSLVEMVVVIGIISILLAIATLKFDDYSKRYRGEAQTRMIYAELLTARANAMYQRRSTRVKLYANRFDVYSSNQDDSAGVAPVRTIALAFPVTSNSNSGDGVNGYPLGFDVSGASTNSCTICLDNVGAAAAVDSIVISETRVSIGKKDKGDECKSSNVTPR